jgi:hypothetical protein
MFEESRLFRGLTSVARPAATASSDAPDPLRAAGLRRAETALKAIAWSDLTARLDAARDLRLALRHEARRSIGDAGASFSDAAAKYFRALEDSERGVNLGSLEHSKGCNPILPECGDRAEAIRPDAAMDREDARDKQ